MIENTLASISAIDIADALGMPRPTIQQQRVIEADLSPALVVAGAGSGKTETMANRVLWLLANRHVTAGQVLGLTFTRKAAGELATRIRERIAQLAAAGLISEAHDPFDPPAVATYNSFANSIFRDHATLIGREPDGAVLGAASAWQLARGLVVASTDSRLAALGRSVDTITRDVINLAHALSENVADSDAVVEMAGRFAALAELPPGGRGTYPAVDTLVARVSALGPLVALADQFAEAKARRGFVEYSDQVALALDIVRRVPSVTTEFRERYAVVLLDEYQDTSVVQTWLLSELFGGHPVMAVGDPNQSIYGWRGASAANLEQFGDQFAGGAAQEFALSTSWRNGHDILAVANALVEPLAGAGTVAVEKLTASPRASAVPVEIVFEETLAQEAAATAEWLQKKLATPAGVTPPSAAILFRARKTQGAFIEALRERGVPFHVLGVGGLMAEPEVADLVSALTVVGDPAAGSELVRLLAGSRWRIGVRDLRALSDVARWLASRDHNFAPLAPDVREALRSSVAEGEDGSIVEALDFVASAPVTHSLLAEFSPDGLDRLRDAGSCFARLRARSRLELLDFITLVQQEFQLDIEVIANSTRPLGTGPMDAFIDAVTGFIAVDDSASLPAFLGWLREAEWRDNLAPRPEEPEPGTVQLMTIHGSKGLERDIVVVPRAVDGEMPASPNEGYVGWLSYGALPYSFRGDGDELPEFDWTSATTRKELVDAYTAFQSEVRERHEREERRLAYVAVTRARHSLLVSGSFWASQTKPRQPSVFLRPLSERGLLPAFPPESSLEENPNGDAASTFSWPTDPLGSRRAALEAAAAQVRDAQPGSEAAWEKDISLLLEERKRRLAGEGEAPVPTRVPASRFKDFVSDPEAVAASLRRPMPERPFRATRLGTLFHEWVESRYGMFGGRDELDAAAIESDSGPTGGGSDGGGSDGGGPATDTEREQLHRLQRIFEKSEWAARRPVEIEREIHLPLAGKIVICKIDAVFFTDGRYQIVDWKTGKAPKDAADLEEKQLQLALYRLAFARWREIDIESIDAVFYFVSDDRVVAPERIFTEAELVERWTEVYGLETAVG